VLRIIPIVLSVLFLCSLGCESEVDTCSCGSHGIERQVTTMSAPFPGAWAELVANHHPGYEGTATLTFRYEFRLTPESCDNGKLVAHGYFGPLIGGQFTCVAGESTWVDTVSCFERREHSIEIRALRRGELVIEGVVWAPLDSTWHPGGYDDICLCAW
jgi:hypothetical protein